MRTGVLLSIILLSIQFFAVFFAGINLSTAVPGAIFAPDGKMALSVAIVTTLLYPLLGLLGLMLSLINIFKKRYNIIFFILLIVSLGFLTLKPAQYLTQKIAGEFNYKWTEQYSKNQQIEFEKEQQEEKEAEILLVNNFEKIDRVCQAHYEYFTNLFLEPQVLVEQYPNKLQFKTEGGLYVFIQNLDDLQSDYLNKEVFLKLPPYEIFRDKYLDFLRSWHSENALFTRTASLKAEDIAEYKDINHEVWGAKKPNMVPVNVFYP